MLILSPSVDSLHFRSAGFPVAMNEPLYYIYQQYQSTKSITSNLVEMAGKRTNWKFKKKVHLKSQINEKYLTSYVCEQLRKKEKIEFHRWYLFRSCVSTFPHSLMRRRKWKEGKREESLFSFTFFFLWHLYSTARQLFIWIPNNSIPIN